MKHGNFYKFAAFLLTHEFNNARNFKLILASGGTTVPNPKRRNKVNNFQKYIVNTLSSCDGIRLYIQKHQTISQFVYNDNNSLIFPKTIFTCSQDRSEKIEEATALLDKKEISPQIFLNRIVFKSNGICDNLDLFECVDTGAVESEDESQDELQTQEQVDIAPVLRLMPCCVCMDNTSQVILHPCGHVKVCADCWELTLEFYSDALAKFMERDLDEEYRPYLRCPFCRAVVTEHTKSIFT